MCLVAVVWMWFFPPKVHVLGACSLLWPGWELVCTFGWWGVVAVSQSWRNAGASVGCRVSRRKQVGGRARLTPASLSGFLSCHVIPPSSSCDCGASGCAVLPGAERWQCGALEPPKLGAK